MDIWVKELEKIERDKLKSFFKIGWLTACLKGVGWTDAQVEAELDKAEVAANKFPSIYNRTYKL